jgi:hypothetical protein
MKQSTSPFLPKGTHPLWVCSFLSKENHAWFKKAYGDDKKPGNE